MYHRAGRPLRRLGWLAPVSSPPPVKLQALPSILIVRPVARPHPPPPNSNHFPKPRRPPRCGRENSHWLPPAIKSCLASRKLPSILHTDMSDYTRQHQPLHHTPTLL